MRCFSSLGFTIAIVACLIPMVAVETAHADLVFGAAARAQFEDFRTNLGDEFIDFESVASGPLTNQISGLSFRTTFGRNGATGSLDLPVAVLPWNFVSSSPRRIIGVRSGSPSYIPEGQNVYEINFDSAQRRAGLLRPWSTFSLTRFYAGNTLLGVHRNTVNSEFVGFIAESNDPSTWITRIEIDGLSDSGVFQVGTSDDIFFGSVAAVPEPTSMALFAFATCAFGLRRSRRR